MNNHRTAIGRDGVDYHFKTGNDSCEQYRPGDVVADVCDLITDGVAIEFFNTPEGYGHRFRYGLVVIHGGIFQGVVPLPKVEQWPAKVERIGKVLHVAADIRERFGISHEDTDLFRRYLQDRRAS